MVEIIKLDHTEDVYLFGYLVVNKLTSDKVQRISLIKT